MNVKWHYWCGTKVHATRYIKYLVISVDSLINVGKIKPEDIYATIEPKLLGSTYGSFLNNIGIHILEAPEYTNYSKQICYHRLYKKCPYIDKIVQIDCDTIVTDPFIIEKIINLQGCVNIDSMNFNLYDAIQRRDGQKHKSNNIFSIGTENVNPPHSNDDTHKYYAFKDYCWLHHNLDLEDFLQYSKDQLLPVGFIYTISPNELPPGFFEFLSSFNFFFEDDELGLMLAKYKFNLQYESLNHNPINRSSDENIKFQAKTLADFEKYKGIVHFPTKDEQIHQEITELADRVVNKT